MSKKKLAGIIAVCIIAIIAVIVATNSRQPTPTTQTYTLTTYVSPSGAGSVSPPGGQYESGVQITLTATPASGYTFDYWEDLASSSSNTVTITMNAHKAITAHFKVVDHAEQGTLTVHFIDVGQGDSILLDLGDTEVLIDGGADGIRTHYLLTASQTLSRLSYSPTGSGLENISEPGTACNLL